MRVLPAASSRLSYWFRSDFRLATALSFEVEVSFGLAKFTKQMGNAFVFRG